MLIAQTPGKIPSENPLYGRCPIYTDAEEINESNLIQILSDSFTMHMQNSSRIEYLWNYYKGIQPILQRTKDVRPEINNKIVENRAYEIVSFKTGYLLGEPMQYVAHDSETSNGDEILRLNEYMGVEDKASKDKELADWMHICGTGYRIVLPNPVKDEDNPFQVFVPDPRFTFVVYSSGLGHKPMLGVQYIIKEDGTYMYSCWTETELFEVVSDHIVDRKPHRLTIIPVIEYPLNTARLGAFEIVLDLLDAINETDSDRLDGVDQFVQSFFKFINCDIDEHQFVALKQLGALKIRSANQGMPADVQIMTQELDQSQTQVLKADLYQSVLDICGMPNRNGGTSTSDTGEAVIFRDGWSTAETMAKDTELMFKRSERQMLKLVLRILSNYGMSNLRVAQIDMAFTRRNYSNLLVKSQVLTTMLDNPHIHPEQAYQASGMFVDAEAAYKKGDEYYQEQLKQQASMMEDDDDGDVRTGRQNDRQTQRPNNV